MHCRQVDRDCDLLEQERIMDYSLLVGVHFRESRDAAQIEEGWFRVSTSLILFLRCGADTLVFDFVLKLMVKLIVREKQLLDFQEQTWISCL